MKKLILFVVLFLPLKVGAISASSAVVYDADGGRVLYCKSCDTKKLIASTTKIMTTVIALEYGDVNKRIEVGDEILSAYGSAIYIQVGESLTLKELLYGLMLRSGNDAAMTIAKGVTGSMESFVYLMNAKAKSLGMDNTVFYNSHGLEERDGTGNTSTATDMAKLMAYAMKNDLFREITRTRSITVKSNYKTYVWNNKNKLLSMYEYTTGGKTGYTDRAKRTLVTSASKDGKNLVVVTLNDGNDFDDHITLYEEYFEKYESLLVLAKDSFKVEDKEYEDAFIKNDYRLLVSDQERDRVVLNVNIFESARSAGWVGEVEVKVSGKVVHTENIYLEGEVDRVKKAVGFWEKIWSFIKFW